MDGYSIVLKNRDGRKKEVTYMGSVQEILSMVLADCIRGGDAGWFFKDGQVEGNAVYMKGPDGAMYGCEVISAKPVEIV